MEYLGSLVEPAIVPWLTFTCDAPFIYRIFIKKGGPLLKSGPPFLLRIIAAFAQVREDTRRGFNYKGGPLLESGPPL